MFQSYSCTEVATYYFAFRPLLPLSVFFSRLISTDGCTQNLAFATLLSLLLQYFEVRTAHTRSSIHFCAVCSSTFQFILSTIRPHARKNKTKLSGMNKQTKPPAWKIKANSQSLTIFIMPSLVRTAIIVSVVLSLARSISAGGRCCPGDNICSGCWMCKGSDLRDCWDRATPMPTKCEAISDLQEKAACYCKGYAAIAKCWSAGTCCTEYAPTLAVATDLCNLASWPSDQITQAKIDHCVKEAARVADAIWHNDSGVDVPKAQSHIPPYVGGPVATGVAHVKHKAVQSESYVGSPADPPPPTSSQNHYHKHKSSYHHSSSYTHSAEKQQKKKLAQEKKKHKWEEKQKKKEWEAKKKAKKLADKKWKEHHHEDKAVKHSERDEGCKEKSNHTKRASYTTLNMSPEEIKDMRLGKRHVQCGIDFQGVPHPSVVPDMVQKAYDEI